MPWYDANFAYKKALVIPRANVSGGSDLLDFPLLVSITSNDLKLIGNNGLLLSSSGYDILFTDGKETRELPFEVESYDGTNGILLCWVRVPVVSASADTVIYLYFGNPTITSYQAQASNVWESHYHGVWHLGNGTTLSLSDSTSNGNTGTNKNGSTAVTGEINGGVSFDGSTQYLDMHDPANGSLDFGTGDFTLEAWFYEPTLPSAIDAIINKGADGIGAGYGLQISASNQIQAAIQGASGTDQKVTGPTISAATWYHVVASFPRNDQAYLYLNGALVASAAYASGNTSSVSSTSLCNIGRKTNGTAHYGGSIDEVRVSASARSAGWVATEYLNQSSPSTFLIVGQTIPKSGTLPVPLLLKSGVTTFQTSADFLNIGSLGAKFTFSITQLGSTETFTFAVLGKDVTSGQYKTIASFAGIGLGSTVLTLSPFLPPSSTVANVALPRVFQVQVTPSTSDSASYTVGMSLLAGSQKGV
jgi:hypothetical protein